MASPAEASRKLQINTDILMDDVNDRNKELCLFYFIFLLLLLWSWKEGI